MAHVHKQTFTKPIPAGAERITVKGRPCVRWRGRTKAWQVGEIIADKPGRCRLESAKWYVTFFDPARGDTRTVPGYTDRAATDALMVELVRTAERVDSGLIAPEAARPKLTLVELIDRWERYVRHDGASAIGARRQRKQAESVCDGVGAVRVADLTPSAVIEWVGTQRLTGGRRGKGISAATASNYVGAIKTFTRWCAVVEKCEPVDHLSGLAKTRDETDRRHVRRALAPDQLDHLLLITRTSAETVYGLTGIERHALYLVACSTGLRAAELSRLTGTDFASRAATVTARNPAKTKTRSADTLPLDPDVADLIAPVVRAAGAGPVWPNRVKPSQAWWLLGARLIRHDLAAAGIPARDELGRVFDFHSLRGQFATDLDRAGVSLARAQKLMRHSTPALTSKHYTNPDAAELAHDVAKLRRGGSQKGRR